MLRGQVVGEDARAWTAGLLFAGDYFTRARHEAVAAASRAIRRRLRQRRVRSADPGTSR